MGWLSVIVTIFDPILDIVKNINMSKEKKMELQQQINNSKKEMMLRGMEIEAQIIKAGSDAISAEAKGDSWLQRNWRPLTMVSFVLLIWVHWIGWTPANIKETEILAVFEIVKYGLGGYVLGRSAEKGLKIYKNGK